MHICIALKLLITYLENTYYTQNDKVENMCFKIESGVKTTGVEGFN